MRRSTRARLFLLWGGAGLAVVSMNVSACADQETESKNQQSEIDGAVGDGAEIVGDVDASRSDVDSGSAHDPDGGANGACQAELGEMGGECEQRSCKQGLLCMPEQTARIPVHQQGTGAELTVDFTMFSGGVCSKPCLLGGEDCGPCATCSRLSFIGRYLTAISPDPFQGVCALRCEPSLADNGGCPSGYTCAPDGVCLNACTSDEQCKLFAEDLNGDGEMELVLDPDSSARCNLQTGLCDHPENEVGDACRSSADCGAYGECLTGEGEASGVCVRGFCEQVDGFACDPGQVCNVRLADTVEEQNSICLPGCKVGAESTELRLGPESHGENCPAGFACLWDGVSAVDDPLNGGCFPTPGHNSITEPNIGQLCTSHDECYSPWGLGLCEFLDTDKSLPGICVVGDCSNAEGGTSFDGILPGVPSELPICPEGQGVCIDQSAPGLAATTYCYKPCTDDEDCPGRFACSQPFLHAPRVCWP